MNRQQALYSIIGLVFGAKLGYEVSGFIGYESIGAVVGAALVAALGLAYNYFIFSD